MNLAELQEKHKQRLESINQSLVNIESVFENAVSELSSIQETLKVNKNEIHDLEMEKVNISQGLSDLQEQHKTELIEHRTTVKNLQSQEERLRNLIKDAQEQYSKRIQESNALRDTLIDDKKDLKERELSLNAKLRAFKKEREEFNFEKRKFQAEKSELIV